MRSILKKRLWSCLVYSVKIFPGTEMSRSWISDSGRNTAMRHVQKISVLGRSRP